MTPSVDQDEAGSGKQMAKLLSSGHRDLPLVDKKVHVMTHYTVWGFLIAFAEVLHRHDLRVIAVIFTALMSVRYTVEPL